MALNVDNIFNDFNYYKNNVLNRNLSYNNQNSGLYSYNNKNNNYVWNESARKNRKFT